MGEHDPMTIPIPRQIARLSNGKIVTRSTSKNWQAKNTKRRRVDVARTVPFVYNAWHMEVDMNQEMLEAIDILADE